MLQVDENFILHDVYLVFDDDDGHVVEFLDENPTITTNDDDNNYYYKKSTSLQKQNPYINAMSATMTCTEGC